MSFLEKIDALHLEESIKQVLKEWWVKISEESFVRDNRPVIQSVNQNFSKIIGFKDIKLEKLFQNLLNSLNVYSNRLIYEVIIQGFKTSKSVIELTIIVTPKVKIGKFLSHIIMLITQSEDGNMSDDSYNSLRDLKFGENSLRDVASYTFEEIGMFKNLQSEKIIIQKV